jgi:hypothetical protein
VVTVLDVTIARPAPANMRHEEQDPEKRKTQKEEQKEEWTYTAPRRCPKRPKWLYPTARLPTEEIFDNIWAGAQLTSGFVWSLAMAGVIAAVGLFLNSSVMLVASMLISPMMGPVLAITFGMAIKTHPRQSITRGLMRGLSATSPVWLSDDDKVQLENKIRVKDIVQFQARLTLPGGNLAKCSATVQAGVLVKIVKKSSLTGEKKACILKEIEKLSHSPEKQVAILKDRLHCLSTTGETLPTGETKTVTVTRLGRVDEIQVEQTHEPNRTGKEQKGALTKSKVLGLRLMRGEHEFEKEWRDEWTTDAGDRPRGCVRVHACCKTDTKVRVDHTIAATECDWHNLTKELEVGDQVPFLNHVATIVKKERIHKDEKKSKYEVRWNPAEALDQKSYDTEGVVRVHEKRYTSKDFGKARRLLIKEGVKSEAVGALVAFLMGFCCAPIFLELTDPRDSGTSDDSLRFGQFWGWPPLTSEMESRGNPWNFFVGLVFAMASGIVVGNGATGGGTNALVGVAISASLLPPVVNSGMCVSFALLGPIIGGAADDWHDVWGPDEETKAWREQPFDSTMINSLRSIDSLQWKFLVLAVISFSLYLMNIIVILSVSWLVFVVKRVEFRDPDVLRKESQNARDNHFQPLPKVTHIGAMAAATVAADAVRTSSAVEAPSDVSGAAISVAAKIAADIDVGTKDGGVAPLRRDRVSFAGLADIHTIFDEEEEEEEKGWGGGEEEAHASLTLAADLKSEATKMRMRRVLQNQTVRSRRGRRKDSFLMGHDQGAVVDQPELRRAVAQTMKSGQEAVGGYVQSIVCWFSLMGRRTSAAQLVLLWLGAPYTSLNAMRC